MSVNVTINGALTAIKAKPSVTTATTIYTAGSDNPWLIGVQVANTSGTAATVLLEVVTATVGYAIIPTMSVPANDAFEGPGFPIPMRSGDIIRATLGTADVIDIIVTVMERPGALN